MVTTASPVVVSLDDPAAGRPEIVGAKAANLARARAAGLPALPGAVLTTTWTRGDLVDAIAAWRDLSSGGALPVVVRSSSTGEDGDGSSMAGVFDSILDVTGQSDLVAAIDRVLASAERARHDGLVDADMAVLVQPMLHARWGGVLFGADPVSGRRDRIVVAAVAGGPDQLVSGVVDGWTGVLDRRGRVREVRSAGDAVRPPAPVLRRLARLAADAARAFGGPQDVEWAVDADDELHLLQARPITTLPPTSGTVFGPGPVAESFPDPLSPLEQDLWLAPLRDGLREALHLAGASPAGALRRSPLVIAVDGVAAADLTVLGVDAPTGGLLRRFDPRPPARRLRAAWRVGRLRTALPQLGTDLVDTVDADLAAVPALTGLGNHQLLALLRNGRRSLVSLHGHEALVGLLIPAATAATVTGASLALSAIAQARAEQVPLDELVERQPVVLALVPPRVGPAPSMAAMADGPSVITPMIDEPDRAAIVREALRLRVRWVQELMARAAWELGRRLVDVKLLDAHDDVRRLQLEELTGLVERRTSVVHLSARIDPLGRRLPTRFRIDDDGRAWAAPPTRTRRRHGP
ncbi:MAG: PEP/pyruvate-binding domain-containing protein, partial [Ilumatobacteraceae bacterium]